MSVTSDTGRLASGAEGSGGCALATVKRVDAGTGQEGWVWSYGHGGRRDPTAPLIIDIANEPRISEGLSSYVLVGISQSETCI